MKANYVNEKNQTASSASELPKVESNAITPKEIIALVDGSKFSFYGAYHAGVLNQNFQYRLIDGNCIRVASKTGWYTVALKIS